VFEDMLLFEKMAHFNRERIPERVVHAKGSGAHGYLICTNADLPACTTAKLFSAVGKRTPTFLRHRERRLPEVACLRAAHAGKGSGDPTTSIRSISPRSGRTAITRWSTSGSSCWTAIP
jgi:catalase